MVTCWGSAVTVHKQLTDYYMGLCRVQDGVPTRADVDPNQFKKILSWVLLAEWHGPRHLVPTLVGGAINDALGGNATGANIFEYYPDDVSEALEPYYQKLLSHPCGGFFVRSLEKKNGAAGTLEAQFYPLRDNSGQINRLIGSMFFQKTERARPGSEDHMTFSSMSITQMDYLDIGYGVPKD